MLEAKKEKEELRAQIDPVKVAQASQGPAVGALHSEELEQLRKECSDLRSQLREAEFEKSSGGGGGGTGGISSEEAQKYVSREKGTVARRIQKGGGQSALLLTSLLTLPATVAGTRRRSATLMPRRLS